jgi:hypothetical protein
MDANDRSTANDPTIMGNDRPRREPEGEEGASTQREGRYADEPGYGRRAHDHVDETDSSIKRSGPQPGGHKFSQDDDVPTHGPEDKRGEERETT